MKLPHTYKGFQIIAEQGRTNSKWYLRIQTMDDPPITVRSYTPPLQVIYIGAQAKLAYDHDIKQCEAYIDKRIKKLGGTNGSGG